MMPPACEIPAAVVYVCRPGRLWSGVVPAARGSGRRLQKAPPDMTAKPPAFQFYPRDWLVDTEHLTLEQQAAYLRLICHCWLGSAGPGYGVGELPDDPLRLAKLAQIGAKRRQNVLPQVELMFHKSSASSGTKVLRHKRLDEEREKQEAYAASQSMKGKRGAAAKWGDGRGHSPAMAERWPGDGSASASASAIRDKDKEKEAAPPSVGASETAAPTGGTNPLTMSFPLKSGSQWRPTPDQSQALRDAYPAFEFDATLTKHLSAARGWLVANPAKRKTERGMMRFLMSWLARAAKPPPNGAPTGRAKTNSEIATARDAAFRAAMGTPPPSGLDARKEVKDGDA